MVKCVELLNRALPQRELWSADPGRDERGVSRVRVHESAELGGFGRSDANSGRGLPFRGRAGSEPSAAVLSRRVAV